MKSDPAENRLEVAGDEHKHLLSGGPRKTRDLPNLSECQACGLRIDVCSGKSRIQLLYSEWRVLLLCKKCFVLVESSEICSYCYKVTSREDCVRCCQCGRSVHNSCFWQYKTSPPWRCSCSGMDLLVCVDCWVPKPIASKRGFLSKRGRGLKPGDSKVSVGCGCVQSLEDMVCDANGVFVKEVEAKNNAMELADSAFDLVASGDESCKNVHNSDGNVADDMELAFHLHRAINSSPRISKNMGLSNSACSTLPMLKRSLHSRGGIVRCNPEFCTDGSVLENQGNDSCPSADVGTLNSNKSVEMDHLKPKLRVYTRTRWKHGKSLWKLHDGDKNKRDKLMEGKENCATRWVNVYVRTRWRNGYVWNTNGSSEKREERSMNVYVRTRLKSGKCLQKLSGNFPKAEASSMERDGLNEDQERCSTRFVNVYTRTRLRNGKCISKLSGDFPRAEPRLMDGEGLTGGHEKYSTRLMNVCMRTRSKSGERMQKLDGQNAQGRLEKGKGNSLFDLNNSFRDALGFALRAFQVQDESAVLKDEGSNVKLDRYSIKYCRKISSK